MAGDSDYEIICDFDGTVTEHDVAARIIMEYGSKEWEEIERRFMAGEITSREELREQFSHVSAPEKEIYRYIEIDTAITPGFSEFMEFVESKNIPFTIVSEGLEFYINAVMKREGFSPEIVANEGHFRNGCIELEYHSEFDEKCGKCGNCKSGYLDTVKSRGKKIIYVGDGVSDFCPSKKAEIIFARKNLAEHLAAEGIEFYKYQDFFDIVAKLEEII